MYRHIDRYIGQGGGRRIQVSCWLRYPGWSECVGTRGRMRADVHRTVGAVVRRTGLGFGNHPTGRDVNKEGVRCAQGMG